MLGYVLFHANFLFYFDLIATCTTDFSGRNPVLVGAYFASVLSSASSGVFSGVWIQLLAPEFSSLLLVLAPAVALRSSCSA